MELQVYIKYIKEEKNLFRLSQKKGISGKKSDIKKKKESKTHKTVSGHFVFLSSHNGNFDINTGLEVDGSELLDGVLGSIEVNKAFVDLHFIAIPGVGTITARSLTSDVVEGAGGETDGSLDGDGVLFVTLGNFLGARDEVGHDLFDGSSVAGPESDADLVVLRFTALLNDVSHDWIKLLRFVVCF